MFFRLFDSFGKRLDEAHKDLFRVMKTHWVDTAAREDLDKLGAIYDMERKSGEKDSDYRRRLKAAIYEYKGGGTVSAILSLTRNLLSMEEEEKLELSDNPPALVSVELRLRSGDTWTLGSSSIKDATPKLTLFVEAGDALFDAAKFNESKYPLGVRNPMITNLETNESVVFRNTMGGGQKLVISEEKAELDGTDVTDRLSMTKMPLILRRGSTWRYREAAKEKIGVFGEAIFDVSLFETALATVKICFEWTAHQVATFELKVPREALARSGLSVENLEEFVNRVKAVGTKGIITLID